MVCFSRRLLKKVYSPGRERSIREISLTLVKNGTTWELVELEAGISGIVILA